MAPMQTRLTTLSQSWAQSVRIALLSEGLHPLVSDEWALAGPSAGAPLQVVTVPETELAKARLVLAKLPPPDEGSTSGIQRLGLTLVGCGLALGSYALVRLTDFGSEPLGYLLLVAGVTCVVSGVVLILRRPHVSDNPLHQTKNGAA